MFDFFTYFVGIALIGVFVYLDGPNIVKHNLTIKCNKFRKINQLVSTNYKGVFTIIWISLCLIIKALWINMLQYMNSTVVQLDKNKYIITYVIKGKTYKMIVKPIRGPKQVLLVYDENQEDVSHLIFPYLGPEENWHYQVYTPNFFNKNELTFELSNGNQKVFLKNDNIML